MGKHELFRYLTQAEFFALKPEERAEYLVRAQDALEEQRRVYQEQAKKAETPFR